jgi:excisionase family DNA binding protein
MTTIRALISIPEAAAYIGIGKSTFYKLMAQGEFRGIRIGRRTLISTTQLRQWVEKKYKELDAGSA